MSHWLVDGAVMHEIMHTRWGGGSFDEVDNEFGLIGQACGKTKRVRPGLGRLSLRNNSLEMFIQMK